MNQRNFPVHGNLKLSTQDQILVIEGHGPANLEMVLLYQKEVMAYRQKIMHSPWASIVLLSGEPLVPPEAKLIFVETIKQAKIMGLKATAVVLIDVEYISTVKQFWSEIYTQSDISHGFFESEQEALSWLNTKLG
ncbi:hypothetical protein [Aliiglaciecola sp. LCG003]|uniref:hypothetical protein n=1 Tax=Aliiglaciecola sp. LCG003 TaxID=3053655 RepID=UPI0025724E1C|nr:hypothetical protein [Aliiglaciecola sp. LCG003]WJG10338.1 hypothetical protein QR722_04690 [Aliiglaciecola sp. LCG003]